MSYFRSLEAGRPMTSDELKDEVMTKDELIAVLEALTTPIDFAGLIKRQVLRKAGPRSYFLLGARDDVPTHAWMQVRFSSPTKSGPKLTFMSPTRAQRLLTKVRR